jgi:hypothetical protein
MSYTDVYEIVRRKLINSRYGEEDIADAIKEAEHQIRNFCGFWQYQVGDTDNLVYEDLPVQLNYVWANIAIDYLSLGYRTSQMTAYDGGAIVDASAIKSIKEGDTTIEFAGAASSGSSSSGGVTSVLEIVKTYADELYPFRRLYPNVRGV